MVLAPGVRGERPAQARALNVALHAGVIAMAFVVARLTLPSLFAAGLATLVYALTPKAPAIAVLWISARGEILMALFSLASIAAWIVWTRQGRAWWLAAAVAAYGLALLSKETAALLPLLLRLTPRPERSTGVRAAAVAGFVALAMLIFAWRSQTGALTPFSANEHYSPAISVALWARNAINYAGRMIPAPVLLLAVLGLARLTGTRRPIPAGSHWYTIDVDVIAFAGAFVVVFLAPVLPISLRSELYLYLPVFGVCLLAGWVGAMLFYRLERRSLIIAAALYVTTLGGYQVVRARDIQKDLKFSEKLIAAVRGNPQLASAQTRVLLMPSDDATERSLRSAIDGYFYLALQHAFTSGPRAGAVQYAGDPPHQTDVRLLCAYRQGDGAVVISPAP